MMRTLALIACLAGGAYGLWDWDTQSVLVKFAFTLTKVGEEAFIKVPVNQTNAESLGWVEYAQDGISDGYSSLVMYGPGEKDGYDPTVCALYDDTGFIAGLQIAINKAHIANATFDWTDQGFKTWNLTFPNGTTYSYWTCRQHYASPETLAIATATRISSRDPTKVLQDKSIWVTGFDGNLYNISTNTSLITGSDSIYTKQACIPWMGHHYTYNLTTSQECTAKKLLNWFPLLYSNRLIGVGFIAFFKLTTGNKYFEHPTASESEMIAPDAPQCFYDLATSPGAVTMHTYFIDPAWTITCVFESSSA